ncbi:MAG: 50S ribosomal protein L4 [Spirochaetes bacterium]|nr:50S ribosomal protein L4 [Spirochaetota bacterium]
MKVELLDINGSVKGDLDLDDRIMNAKDSLGAIYQKFVNENANLHPGTVMKKNRGMVRGGGKKPWRQKGTGRARTGSIRTPLRRGGGMAFGGQKKVYKYTLPKQIRLKAIASALSLKYKQGVVKFIEEPGNTTGKTKQMAKILSKIVKKNKGKIILILQKSDKELLRSLRNISHLEMMNAARMKLLPLVDSKNILITRSAAEYLNEIAKGLKG